MSGEQTIKTLLEQLILGRPLNEQQAYQAFEQVMSGEAEQSQIAALLTAIQVRRGGGAGGEIVGAPPGLRPPPPCVAVPGDVDVIDTCGTGGDASGTFNISTAAALIAAGAGVHVAKHGNRSVTSSSGSSQVLEELGVNLQVEGDVLSRCLAEARLCFCFAPAHHPAMKYAVPVRAALGFRTIFNVLGPLTNPAGARRQVMGVFDDRLTEPIARVLDRLGSVHAMIVHGKTIARPDTTGGGGGLDEITTTGPTRITVLLNGEISTSELHPHDLDLELASVSDLRTESVAGSAEVVKGVLAGEAGPAREIAALNAAAALVVADHAADLKDGLAQARAALDDGHAQATLDKLIEITNAG